MTPRLSLHARERCAEMGISTKVAKRIVQRADVVRQDYSGSDRLISVSDRHPEYIVVHTDPPPGEPPVIITVGFRSGCEYLRDGSTYIPTGSP